MDASTIEESPDGSVEDEGSFLGSVIPREEGECTFEIEVFDSPLHGQTAEWNVTIVDSEVD